MNTHRHPRSQPRRAQARRIARRGQSLVEYGLALCLISILTMGTLRTLVAESYSTLRGVVSTIDISDDITPTPVPASPTPYVQAEPTPVLTQCIVPAMATGSLQFSQALTLWTGAGFAAENLKATGGAQQLGNFVVGTQTLPAGSEAPCASATDTLDAKVCTVPNLVNTTIASAQAAWTNAGFPAGNLVVPASAQSDSIVATQSPAPTKPNGQAITVLGCGLTTTLTTPLCEVPNLQGLQFTTYTGGSLSAAHEAWTARGFAASRLVKPSEVADNFPVGVQDPAVANPAQLIDCKSPMVVRPDLCNVPNMVGSNYDVALQAWTDAGFTAARLTVPSGTLTSTNFLVEGQIPAYSANPPSQLDCGTGTVQVVPKLCKVPDVIGQSFNSVSSTWMTTGRPTNQFTTALVRGPSPTGDFTIAKLTPAAGSDIACSQPVTAEAAMCTVPNMENATVAAARTANASWRFFQGVAYTGTLSLPGGLADDQRVRMQTPAPGSLVACTSPISLSNEYQCVVPNFTSPPVAFDVANNKFKGALPGGAAFTVDLAKTAGLTGNFIIGGQNPAAGTTQSCNQTVTVDAPLCTVPSFNGRTLDEARRVNDNGWRTYNGRVHYQDLVFPAGMIDNDRVTNQNPTAGTRVNCDAAVTLNELLCQVPNFVTNPFTKYDPANDLFRDSIANGGGGFTVDLTKGANSSGNFNIAFQSPAAGTEQSCSEPVTVSYGCQVPTLTGTTPKTYSWALSNNNGSWTKNGFPAANLIKIGDDSPDGTYYIGSQTETGGTRITCETPMTVTKVCKVPDLVTNNRLFSWSQDSANSGSWANAGFTGALVKSTAGADLDDFGIFSQSLTKGTYVDCDTPMTVGPKVCTVPNLANKLYSWAIDNSKTGSWTKNGFLAANLLKGTEASAFTDFVIGSQSLTAGTQVACVAPMTVERKLCTVPDLVTGTRSFDQSKDSNEPWQQNGFLSGNLLRHPTNFNGGYDLKWQQYEANSQLACHLTMKVSDQLNPPAP